VEAKRLKAGDREIHLGGERSCGALDSRRLSGSSFSISHRNKGYLLQAIESSVHDEFLPDYPCPNVRRTDHKRI
jgi:hypothetical protein